MKALLFAAALVVCVPALAQVRVDIPLPTISFPAPPPMVVVAPGVQVVEDNDEEVFFSDGYYWHRRGPTWFRTRTHNGGWVVVEPALVPRGVVAVPEGKYRRWHHEVREDRREDRRDEHKEKNEEKREKHEEKKEHKGKH